MTAVALADARAQMAEEALSLSGSLNVRRTVVSLITLFRPRLADWATLVMPDSVTGGLVLFGGNDASFSTVVARDSVARPGLDRILRTGRTELRVAAEAVPADELSSMIPYPELRAEAVELRPGAVLGLGLTARGTTLGALVIVRGHGRGFDDDEVAFAERIASRAAMALASARMYEERASSPPSFSTACARQLCPTSTAFVWPRGTVRPPNTSISVATSTTCTAQATTGLSRLAMCAVKASKRPC